MKNLFFIILFSSITTIINCQELNGNDTVRNYCINNNHFGWSLYFEPNQKDRKIEKTNLHGYFKVELETSLKLIFIERWVGEKLLEKGKMKYVDSGMRIDTIFQENQDGEPSPYAFSCLTLEILDWTFYTYEGDSLVNFNFQKRDYSPEEFWLYDLYRDLLHLKKTMSILDSTAQQNNIEQDKLKNEFNLLISGTSKLIEDHKNMVQIPNLNEQIRFRKAQFWALRMKFNQLKNKK